MFVCTTLQHRLGNPSRIINKELCPYERKGKYRPIKSMQAAAKRPPAAPWRSPPPPPSPPRQARTARSAVVERETQRVHAQQQERIRIQCQVPPHGEATDSSLGMIRPTRVAGCGSSLGFTFILQTIVMCPGLMLVPCALKA